MAQIGLSTLLGRFAVDKATEQWDDVVKGLGVRINADGSSVFIAKWTCNKKQFKKTIGPTAMITLDQARRLVMRMKVLAKNGDDPSDLIRSFISGHGIVKNGSVTFDRFADIYIERYAKEHKKSWLKDAQNIDFHLRPIWKDKRLAEITRADVAELHAKIGKTRPYAANRLKELISTMWRQAIILGYLPENHPSVVLGVREYKERERDDFIPKEKLPHVFAAIQELSCPYQQAAIKFMLFTGLRSSEAIKLKWSEVDMRARLIRVGETKNGKPHRLPLSSQAIEILESLKKLEHNPHVFPGKLKGRSLSRIDKAWDKVRKSAGIPNIRPHDLRRTAGSYLVQATHSLPLVGEVLNQTTQHVTRIYSRYDKDSVRQAVNVLGDTISSWADQPSSERTH